MTLKVIQMPSLSLEYCNKLSNIAHMSVCSCDGDPRACVGAAAERGPGAAGPVPSPGLELETKVTRRY